MNESKIICPHCHTEMPLSEAVSHQIRQDFEARFENERQKLNSAIADREAKLTREKEEIEKQKLEDEKHLAEKLDEERKKIEETAARRASENVSKEVAEIQAQLAQKSQSLEAAKKAEAELAREKAALLQAKEDFDAQMRRTLESERAKIAEEAVKREKDNASIELNALNQRLAEQAESLKAAKSAELDLLREKSKLEQAKEDFDAQMLRTLESERAKIAEEAAKREKDNASIELNALNQRLTEQAESLKAAKNAELDLLREKSKLEQAKEDLALEVQRTLTQERQKIAEEARKQGVEQERLTIADKDNVIRQLQEKISELKQSAEQGSMQAQGETLELEIENSLGETFRDDEIVEVKKGQQGADMIQRVRTRQGGECGSIVWEAKRAKAWSSKWVAKLKSDQREAKADLAVIVTTCPPDGVSCIALHEGVWVCEPPYAIALATALRQGLIHTAAQRIQQENRADKMSQIYDHLCSTEFRQTVETIVDSFLGLKRQLDSEKVAMAKQWKERESQLATALTGVAGLYGGIQGIAGREALPEIRNLALPAA